MPEQPITQGFEEFITNFPSAQSFKTLPNKGFCLYNQTEYFEPVSENGMLLPIRATEPRKVNIVRVSAASSCNFYESLLGIETGVKTTGDDESVACCNFYESLLGIETSVVWNCTAATCSLKLQFLRIPIRD